MYQRFSDCQIFAFHFYKFSDTTHWRGTLCNFAKLLHNASRKRRWEAINALRGHEGHVFKTTAGRKPHQSVKNTQTARWPCPSGPQELGHLLDDAGRRQVLGLLNQMHEVVSQDFVGVNDVIRILADLIVK